MKKSKFKKVIERLERRNDFLNYQVDILCGNDLYKIALVKIGRELIHKGITDQILGVRNPPKPPLDRVILEGALFTSGLCPNCHSTAIRKPRLFGKRYCVNEGCIYYSTPINSDVV